MTAPRLGHWAWAVGVCLAALVALLPSQAWAQTCPNISISVNPTVPRFTPGPDVPAGGNYAFRPQNLNPTYINYQDCKDNIHLQFTIIVSGLPCTDTIQVWAGTVDCTQTAARQADSGQTHCWPVTPTGAFAMQQSSTGDIRAQDAVAFITNQEPPEIYTPQGATACQAQASPGGVSLSLYFMAVEADGLTVDGTSAEYDFGADLIGPYPPSNVTAGVGENLIVVNWTPAVDSTIQGFNIYCEAQNGGPTEAGITDAAEEATLVCPDTGVSTTLDGALDGTTDAEMTVSDASGCHYVNLFDAGSSSASSCVSSALVNEFVLNNVAAPIEGGVDGSISTGIITEAGEGAATGLTAGVSDIPGKYLCGQVGGNTTSSYVVTNFIADGGGTGMPIVDGTQYAVTVAATDGSGNTGIIGDLSCVIPAPVVDFWTAYTGAGGQAGGGFCSVQEGLPESGAVFSFAAGVAVITFGRRRRRRRR